MKLERKNSQTDTTVEILYQKLGDRWFAFSMIEDEIYFGAISQELIDASKSSPKPIKII